MADKTKTELDLNINNFKKSSTIIGYKAVIFRILNLLFMEKGTKREAYNMGIGIQNYIFEHMTESLKAQINLNIRTQINEWIDDVEISEVILTEIEMENKKALEIELQFEKPIDNVIATKLSLTPTKDKIDTAVSVIFNN